MLRFVSRHVRWAGIVVQFAGIAFNSIPLMIFGTVIFFGSYLWAHTIMEQMYLHIEDAANAEKEKEEDDSTQQ